MQDSAFPFPTEIDGPLVVIGDVHGQTWHLDSLLNHLNDQVWDLGQRWIVFMGDFVDRGSDPKGAVTRVLSLFEQHQKVTAVMGNHELALVGALKLIPAPDSADWENRYTMYYNSESTFHSYGAQAGDLHALKEVMPLEHQSFLASLPWCVEHPDYLIVHAGLLPDRPYENQLETLRKRDFNDGRPPWLCSRKLKKVSPPKGCSRVIVSGHLKVSEPIIQKQRIMIDTTGGFGGKLSAILLPEREVITS